MLLDTRRRNAPPAMEAVETQPRRAPGARVLLVDDDADAVESFRYLLEHAGYAVTALGSGAAALEACAAGRHDVLVSDLDMPEMDGCTLLRTLRARPATARLPALALSGHATPDDVARALAAGFDRHMAKPADADAVARVIDVLLETPHEQRARG